MLPNVYYITQQSRWGNASLVTTCFSYLLSISSTNGS